LVASDDLWPGNAIVRIMKDNIKQNRTVHIHIALTRRLFLLWYVNLYWDEWLEELTDLTLWARTTHNLAFSIFYAISNLAA